jgi:hypothetical protein
MLNIVRDLVQLDGRAEWLRLGLLIVLAGLAALAMRRDGGCVEDVAWASVRKPRSRKNAGMTGVG